MGWALVRLPLGPGNTAQGLHDGSLGLLAFTGPYGILKQQQQQQQQKPIKKPWSLSSVPGTELQNPLDFPENFRAVQWLGLYAFTAEGEGPSSVPGRETKIPQALWYDQKKEKEKKKKTLNFPDDGNIFCC